MEQAVTNQSKTMYFYGLLKRRLSYNLSLYFHKATQHQLQVVVYICREFCLDLVNCVFFEFFPVFSARNWYIYKRGTIARAFHNWEIPEVSSQNPFVLIKKNASSHRKQHPFMSLVNFVALTLKPIRYQGARNLTNYLHVVGKQIDTHRTNMSCIFCVYIFYVMLISYTSLATGTHSMTPTKIFYIFISPLFIHLVVDLLFTAHWS